MVMMSGSRLVEVAKEAVALVDERTPGYRGDLVGCLVEAIQTQQEGLSDAGRRKRVDSIVEALGGKVAAAVGQE